MLRNEMSKILKIKSELNDKLKIAEKTTKINMCDVCVCGFVCRMWDDGQIKLNILKQ